MCVAYPATLVGDVTFALGIPDDVNARSLLNTRVLVAEIAATAMLAVCSAAFAVRSTRREVA